jgi:Fic family protein
VDIDAFRNTPAGQLVPITGHDEQLREFEYWSFLPAPLPEAVDLNNVTWTRVAEASEALGRLHQACSHLPNPRLLIAPALAREAVDTSALEGTYGALPDVLEARLSQERPVSPEVAEIRAYEHIAYMAFDWVRDRPVTVAMLAELQGILARESKEPTRDPGKVREHQVVIGSGVGAVHDARYIPPPPDDRLRAGLDQWQQWLETPRDLPPVVEAAMAHYQFEALHPFGDGNGRIGRLVIVLHLLRRGTLSEPALTISPWLRRRRAQYQEHLLAISQTGDWNPWLQFFCQAVCEQSRASVAAVDTLMQWLAGVRSELNDRHWSGVVATIVEDLIDWPVITAPFVQSKYSVTAPTAKSAIDRLLEIGVLKEMTGRSYRRVYGAPDVIEAVEAIGPVSPAD